MHAYCRLYTLQWSSDKLVALLINIGCPIVFRSSIALYSSSCLRRLQNRPTGVMLKNIERRDEKKNVNVHE